MNLFKLCNDYLRVTSDIANTSKSQLPDDAKFMESVDFVLNDIHTKIVEELACSEFQLNKIFNNLDIAINFKPPLERYDTSKVYAKDLERLLTCSAGRMFLNNRIHILTTNYGVIR